MAAAVHIKPTYLGQHVITDVYTLEEIPEHLRKVIDLSNLPHGCLIVDRTITYHGRELKFPSVALPRNMDPAKLEEYQRALQALEEVLPGVLFRTVNDKMDRALKIACARLWTFLETFAEINAEGTGQDKRTVLNAMFKNMHENPAFKSIKNFSGNVGADPAAMKAVVDEGNIRERMFFLINVIRNLLKPAIAGLGDDERGQLAQKLSQKLGYPGQKLHYPVNLDLNPAPYFAFSTEAQIRVKDVKDWPKPTVAELSKENEISTPALSERERVYAIAKAGLASDHSGEGVPVYFGSAAQIFRTKTLAEDPDNPYLEAINDAKSPTRCSFSGVTSDILGLCVNALNLNHPDFIRDFRLACLASLLEGKNHSAIEVLLGAASFDKRPVVCSPEWYASFFKHELGEEQSLLVLTRLRESMQRKDVKLLPHEILLKA